MGLTVGMAALMTPETADSLRDRALDMYLRTDGTRPDTAEIVKFDDYRLGGQYVILRNIDQPVAVYKVITRFGPARGDGKGNYVVDSFSLGLKRLKRWPKGLA